MSEILIQINGDISNFEDALKEVNKKTEDLGSALDSLTKRAAVVFAAMTAEIGLSVRAFGESQAASNKLSLALQNQGIYSDALAKKYKDQASALQDLTGIDDDAIVVAQSKVQSMIGQQEITQDLTKAILDLSAGKQIDLDTTAELISKGINGQTTALKKLGIEIDDNLNRQERTSKIIEIVNQKFGDQAAQANKGVGSIKGLQTAFGNFQEEIGARFAPLVETITGKLTKFFQGLSTDKSMMDLISRAIGATAAISGFVAVLGSVASALKGVTAIAAVLGTTLSATMGPVILLATAVVAAGVAIANMAVKTKEAGTPMGQLQERAVELRGRIEELQKTAGTPMAFAVDTGMLEKAKAELADIEERMRKLSSQSSNEFQNSDKKKAAEKAAEEQKVMDELMTERARAQKDVIIATANQQSQQVVELKRQEIELLKQLEDEKDAGVREAVYTRLEDIRQLQETAHNTDIDQKNLMNDEIYANNEEFNQLTVAQQQEYRDKYNQEFQSQLLTEKTALEALAKEKMDKQVKDNNMYLKNQKEFGTAYAEIYKIMHSEIIQGSAKAFGELAQMQTSSSKELKAIGKAAAIANIVIKTAESAMNIFAGFSVIPFIGPILGAAAAGAAIAFGAEQIGRVTGAADGGLLKGGIKGMDSIPVMAQHGELISPAQNFEEVIGSVRAKREAEKSGGSAFGGGEPMEITIRMEMKDDFMDFVETKLVERNSVGISLQRV